MARLLDCVTSCEACGAASYVDPFSVDTTTCWRCSITLRPPYLDVHESGRCRDPRWRSSLPAPRRAERSVQLPPAVRDLPQAPVSPGIARPLQSLRPTVEHCRVPGVTRSTSRRGRRSASPRAPSSTSAPPRRRFEPAKEPEPAVQPSVVRIRDTNRAPAERLVRKLHSPALVRAVDAELVVEVQKVLLDSTFRDDEPAGRSPSSPPARETSPPRATACTTPPARRGSRHVSSGGGRPTRLRTAPSPRRLGTRARVLPTRISSPSWSACCVATGLPFTSVPFLLPRSLRHQMRPTRSNTACTLDNDGSETICRLLRSLFPTRSGSSRSGTSRVPASSQTSRYPKASVMASPASSQTVPARCSHA